MRPTGEKIFDLPGTGFVDDIVLGDTAYHTRDETDRVTWLV